MPTHLMLCEHKKTKVKLIAWARTSRYGHEQGFRSARCCCTCGKEVGEKNPNSKQEDDIMEQLIEFFAVCVIVCLVFEV